MAAEKRKAVAEMAAVRAERMAKLAKQKGVELRRLTQEELLEEAAQTELINRASLEQMLRVEEENRKVIFRDRSHSGESHTQLSYSHCLHTVLHTATVLPHVSDPITLRQLSHGRFPLPFVRLPSFSCITRHVFPNLTCRASGQEPIIPRTRGSNSEYAQVCQPLCAGNDRCGGARVSRAAHLLCYGASCAIQGSIDRLRIRFPRRVSNAPWQNGQGHGGQAEFRALSSNVA